MLEGIKIIKEKKPNQEGSFFYDGEIATGEKGDRYYSLSACGDIKICIDGGDYFNNATINEAIEKYTLTDEKLKKLEEEGRIEWLLNNWFEVSWKEKDSKMWEPSDLGVVADDHDEAIEMLENYMTGEIKH